MGAQPTLSPFPEVVSPRFFAPPEREDIRPLPPQPSLEQLKNQAKSLLAAARRGERKALARVERCFQATPATAQVGASGEPGSHTHTLAQAQLVIAREHGFESWARLRRGVALTPLRTQLERLTERGWPVRRDVMQALRDAGPGGMEVVLEGLTHPHPSVRRGAVDFLDHVATDACVPYLAHLAVHDPDPEVRRRAVHALICERCKENPLETDVLPMVIHAFRHDPNRRVRWTAGGFLGRKPNQPGVQEAFQVALREDPSALVRRAAVCGLRGDGRLAMLAHVAEHDEDWHVRVTAATKIGGMPEYRTLACRVLEEVLGRDVSTRVKQEAHHALKRLSPDYRQRVAEHARAVSLGQAEATLVWRKRHSQAVPKTPRFD